MQKMDYSYALIASVGQMRLEVGGNMYIANMSSIIHLYTKQVQSKWEK